MRLSSLTLRLLHKTWRTFVDSVNQAETAQNMPSDFGSTLSINSLPKYNFLGWSKLKAFAGNKINVTEKLKFVLNRVENIVGIVENAVYQHFLLFPICFSKTSFAGSLKVGIVWNRDKGTNLRILHQLYPIISNYGHSCDKYYPWHPQNCMNYNG